ncbi:hypothetical protein BDR03DRAFT_340884 [Suillus americanus]|nr:hypothetical protein BDR03DRAFT_340884 [Suillus americanus]
MTRMPRESAYWNTSAREKRRPILLKPTNAASAADSSCHPNSKAQFSLQLQANICTLSTTPPVGATTTSSTIPNVTIKHSGRWIRSWLFICCASTEYTHDGHQLISFISFLEYTTRKA